MYIYLIIPVLLIFFICFFVSKKIAKENSEIIKIEEELISSLKIIIKYIPELIQISEKNIDYEDDIFNNLKSSKTKFESIHSNILEYSNFYDELIKNINSIFTLSEAYKNLNSSKEFISLKNIIINQIDVFERIKNIYNEKATKYNENIKKFPKNIFAKLLKFNEIELFLNSYNNYDKFKILEKE